MKIIAICLMRVLLFFAPILVAWPFSALAAAGGSVCLGPNLIKVREDPALGPFIIIDHESPVFAGPSSNNDLPRVIAKELDLNVRHEVKIMFEGKVADSWAIDFRKLGSSMVVIWRATGAWRMEPSKTGQCVWPPNSI